MKWPSFESYQATIECCQLLYVCVLLLVSQGDSIKLCLHAFDQAYDVLARVANYSESAEWTKPVTGNCTVTRLQLQPVNGCTLSMASVKCNRLPTMPFNFHWPKPIDFHYQMQFAWPPSSTALGQPERCSMLDNRNVAMMFLWIIYDQSMTTVCCQLNPNIRLKLKSKPLGGDWEMLLSFSLMLCPPVLPV